MGKKIISACFGMALFMLVSISAANAEECYSCNPLLFPFVVAGATVNAAAAIATAPFRPVYYTYHHRAWVPGHFNRHGHWIHGHWRYS